MRNWLFENYGERPQREWLLVNHRQPIESESRRECCYVNVETARSSFLPSGGSVIQHTSLPPSFKGFEIEGVGLAQFGGRSFCRTPVFRSVSSGSEGFGVECDPKCLLNMSAHKFAMTHQDRLYDGGIGVRVERVALRIPSVASWVKTDLGNDGI